MANPYSSQCKTSGKDKMRTLGGKTPHNRNDNDARVARMTKEYARGGVVHSAGAGSGVGRLEKIGKK